MRKMILINKNAPLNVGKNDFKKYNIRMDIEIHMYID